MRWSLPLIIVCAAACGYGDNLHAPAAPDAAPDASVGPDAATCARGEVLCDGACLDVSTNEANCGDCGSPCHGGEVCSGGTCDCPSGITGLQLPGLEQFIPLGIFTLGIAPTVTLGGLNGLLFGFDTGLPLDTDIDLSTVALGSTPFVGALVGLDVMNNFAIDASYLATAGTIRFTTLCDTEIEGTLTNATFNGINTNLIDGGIPGIDPDGCVVQVNSLSFHLVTTACTPK